MSMHRAGRPSLSVPGPSIGIGYGVNLSGLSQARRPALSTSVILIQGELANRASGMRARVILRPCTAVAADPVPCTITDTTGELSTTTASASTATFRKSGPWLA